MAGLTFGEVASHAKIQVTYPDLEQELDTQSATKSERLALRLGNQLWESTRSYYTVGPEGLPRNHLMDERFQDGISPDFMPVELWNAVFETDKSKLDALKEKRRKKRPTGKKPSRSDTTRELLEGEDGIALPVDEDKNSEDEEERSDEPEDDFEDDEDADYDNNYFDNGEEEGDADGDDAPTMD